MTEKKSVSVVIPNFNGRALLEKYLPPLYRAIANGKYVAGSEVIVVDDASTDDSAAFLSEHYPEIVLLRNEENSGFAKTINRGIFKAGMDLALLLNTDMLLPGDFFDRLIPHFSDPGLFGVQPTIEDERGERCLEGQKLPKKRLGNIHFAEAYPAKPAYTLYLCGGCALTDRVKLQAMGGFSEIYSPFYFEDFDLSIRAWLKGLTCVYTPETAVRHCHSATINGHYSKDCIQRIFSRNRFLLYYLYLTGRDRFFFAARYYGKYIAGKVFASKSNFGLAFAEYLKLKERKARRKEIERAAGKRTLRGVLSRYFYSGEELAKNYLR